ncbi:MAG: pirin family protein [Flavobacteriales bacterium]|nr:pirin family protein [Flavobacteriales bacterium]MBK6946221.1 pirin family protein [Flavobacteriales bacterium]MBK7238827.1 pirin family protein [Flavobacteriales bacterium]MBK9537048.1 pirin family protein [Flavobacteriales bacterium]MBP9139722.1 pirin family protein [Flavobacteriales bacterium]
MTYRPIERVIAPGQPHFVGDGFRVHNFIPHGASVSMERMSPFIMLDYNSKWQVPAANSPRGVGVHPHRGFETVTIAYKGKVAHHDSSGGGGVISEGDVQWMTAASGVLHKEYHEEEFSKHGGIFQMVQLWVNLPSKDKMSTPKYQAIAHEKMAQHQLPDGSGAIEVIAGNYNGTQGPATTFTPVHMYNARLSAGGTADFEFPSNYNTSLLVVEGAIRVNGTENVPTDHFVLLANEAGTITIEATGPAVVLVLSGEPINEPIAAHGPFVMNTQDEIRQAMHDFNQGKFGYLED